MESCRNCIDASVNDEELSLRPWAVAVITQPGDKLIAASEPENIMNERPNGEERRRLIVGITGASGVIYGVRLLELLKETDIETHLIMSRAARMTLAYETDFKVLDVERLATLVHPNENIGAACSSGSLRTMGMVIV